MLNLILGRALRAIPILLLVSIVMFALMHAAPGGPMSVYLTNPNVSLEDIERLERRLGLDRPIYEQYARWVFAFVQGDWGYSYVDGRRVAERIIERLPATFELMGLAFLMAVVGSLAAGLTGALSRGGWLDRIVSSGSILGISIPTFWLGLVLQLLFAVEWRLLPSAGRGAPGALVLPSVTLGFVYWAAWTRYVRANLRQAVSEPYFLAASARGLTRIGLVLHHALPNALFPWVSVLALDLARLFGGAVITETVFAWPGMGSLLVESVYRRDYAVVMALLMSSSALIVLGNLLADIAYRWLDPRVRIGTSESDE